jgi:hypothetical protein
VHAAHAPPTVPCDVSRPSVTRTWMAPQRRWRKCIAADSYSCVPASTQGPRSHTSPTTTAACPCCTTRRYILTPHTYRRVMSPFTPVIPTLTVAPCRASHTTGGPCFAEPHCAVGWRGRSILSSSSRARRWWSWARGRQRLTCSSTHSRYGDTDSEDPSVQGLTFRWMQT